MTNVWVWTVLLLIGFCAAWALVLRYRTRREAREYLKHWHERGYPKDEQGAMSEENFMFDDRIQPMLLVWGLMFAAYCALRARLSR